MICNTFWGLQYDNENKCQQNCIWFKNQEILTNKNMCFYSSTCR